MNDVNDAISRQQAIDALRDWEMCYDWDEHCREEPKEPWVVSPSDVVNKLPPIQPEIIRCKDCEHGVLADGFPHQYFCVFKGDEWNNADYFCGHARKREVTT